MKLINYLVSINLKGKIAIRVKNAKEKYNKTKKRPKQRIINKMIKKNKTIP